MLETVKRCINDAVSTPFPEFYQNYILTMHKRISDAGLKADSNRFQSIDSVNILLSELNKMTSELKEI